MKANIDFKPYICDAIRINGWDDPNHPIQPDQLKDERNTLHEITINHVTICYTISEDDFMLMNGFQILFYTLDDDGNLILEPKPELERKPSEYSISDCIPDGMFISGDSWLMKQDPVSWLIDDWIPKGKSLLQLYGASGTGKSFLAIDWMLSLVFGTQWKDHNCKTSKIVYLCGEGQRGISKRIKAWLNHHEIDKETALKALRENSLCLSESAILSLDNIKKLQEMQKAIDYRGFVPDLIIVDTLNRFMDGNENDTRDSTAYVHACDSLSGKYNCAVLLIHHIGWATDAQNRGRGSSVIHSSVDMDYQIKDTNGTLVLSQEKNKDYEKEQPIYMILSGVKFMDYDITESSAVLIQADKPEIELVKGITRQNDEVICLEAFKAFGVDHNGVVTITVDDFKKHCQGKLTDRKGNPYEGGSFANQFNPNQGKFISRLLGYRVIEPLEDYRKRNGWKLVDHDMLSLFHTYRNQQPLLTDSYQ